MKGKGKTVLLVLGGVLIVFLAYKFIKKSGGKLPRSGSDLMDQAAIMNQKRSVERLANTPGQLGNAIDLAATPIGSTTTTSVPYLGGVGGLL